MAIKYPVATSPSRMRTHDECPKRYYFENVLKLPQPENEHMKRGTEVHKSLHMFVKKLSNSLPKGVRHTIGELSEPLMWLRKHENIVDIEPGLCANPAWKSVDWFDKKAYFRVKLDARYVDPQSDASSVTIIDYKTGKQYPEHTQLMEDYGVMQFLEAPKISEVVTELWYVDQGRRTTAVYDRKAALARLPNLKKRVAAVLNDRKFQPMGVVNGKCAWCPHSKKRGGVCDAG